MNKPLRKFFRFLFLIILTTLFFSTLLQASDLATAIKIVDGDTLKINYEGRETNVRLIGIDTPESKSNKKAAKDAQRSKQDVTTITSMGREATNFVKTLVKPGDKIRVEFDIQQRDRYGRLLCYIYLPNGKMLNEEIVKCGFASPMTIPPNIKHSDKFLKAYEEARKNNKGLWKKE